MSNPSTPSVQTLLAHQEWVRALARTLVRDVDAAEDLAQDALVVALERPPHDGSNLRGWFARVLRNLQRERGRREAGRGTQWSPEIQQVSLPSTSDLVERAEVQQLLVAQVLALEEPYRTTVLLRYFEGLSPQAIADRNRIPLATVTSRLTRAHARLRERLDRSSQGTRRSWMSALAPLLDRATSNSVVPPGILLMSQKLKFAALALALAAVGYVAIQGLPSGASHQEPTTVDQGVVEGSLLQDSEVAASGSRTTDRESVTAEAETVSPPETTMPSLSGTVFTAAGGPAADATVVVGVAGDLQFLETGEEPPEGLVWTTSDAEGRFELFDLPPGPTNLTAGSTASAPSETLLSQLEAGATQADLVLALRRGVRIHGEVVRTDGSPAAQRRVRFLLNAAVWAPPGKRLARHIVTDDLGRFDERHLCPGSWGLVSFPSEEELAEFGGAMPEQMLQATIELEDGQEKFIVLGARSAEAVTVVGLVTSRAGPTGGLMQWIRECEDPMGSQRISKAGADGRYEVELSGPGPWYVRVMGPDAHEEYYLDVPAQAEFERDFRLPSGAISGRVIDSQGAPIEGAHVSHILVEGAAHRLPLALGIDRDESEADGAYRLTGLSPGLYQIGVTHAVLSTTTVSDVRVGADEALENIDLVLEPGRSLRGLLLGADGLPSTGAPVWIHNADGRLVSPISRILTDDEGRFETPALSPGRYGLISQVGRSVAQATDLAVGADASPSAELQLAPGAELIIETKLGGQPVRAHVRVYDLDGRIYSGLRGYRDPWSWQRYPFDSKRKHVGPLPPGTYRVSAHVPGKGTVEREVTLRAAEVRQVHLEF